MKPEHTKLAKYIVQWLRTRNGAELGGAFDNMRVADFRLLHEELVLILASGGPPANWVDPEVQFDAAQLGLDRLQLSKLEAAADGRVMMLCRASGDGSNGLCNNWLPCDDHPCPARVTRE